MNNLQGGKSHLIFPLLILLSFLIVSSGCKDDEENQSQPVLPEITLKDASEITETGFTISWSINRTDISNLKIDLCLKNDFIDLVKSVNVTNTSSQSKKIDGLHGATGYFICITASFNDGKSATSNSKKVFTSYQSENAIAVTVDGLNIKGDLFYLNSNPEKSPAVILMGVFGLPNLWKGTDVFYKLLSAGYICYIFDFRGQGGSDAWPIIDINTLEELEEYANTHARNDLYACYRYVMNHQKVDTTKIALMGGSLGANESKIGNKWPGVKASVGLSTSRLGIEEGLPLHNVLFIVSDQDCNSYLCFEEEAIFLYNSSLEPKKLAPVVPGDYHGLELLGKENIDQEIIDWINNRMND